MHCEQRINSMPANPIALSDAQIASFISDGFVRIDDAFPRPVADECRAILWSLTGCAPDDPRTWTRPVIRINSCEDAPFSASVNTRRLHIAFNQLVGRGRWEPRFSMGTFPIRFPSAQAPGDDGWHVDVSYGWEERPDDFMSWRANIYSRQRALLMLFLYSDVGEDDAPTRIRVGSHQHIARELAPAGEAGLSLGELSRDGYASTAHLPEAVATGPAGTVYLCHPFLVHAAQPHRGTNPKFMAQPPLGLFEPLQLDRTGGGHSPVEQAIRLALGTS
jgi:hypothetical protein